MLFIPPFHVLIGYFPYQIVNRLLCVVYPPHLHLTTSKVMVIVWRLRGNIITTVLYIANVLYRFNGHS